MALAPWHCYETSFSRPSVDSSTPRNLVTAEAARSHPTSACRSVSRRHALRIQQLNQLSLNAPAPTGSAISYCIRFNIRSCLDSYVILTCPIDGLLPDEQRNALGTSIPRLHGPLKLLTSDSSAIALRRYRNAGCGMVVCRGLVTAAEPRTEQGSAFVGLERRGTRAEGQSCPRPSARQR